MSRIYAAYSAGALLGPALGGVTVPFLAYAALLAALAPAVAALPRLPAARFVSDMTALRSRRFWISALAIMLAILAIGALDGVMPLHFAQAWSQTTIGVAYLLVGGLLVVGSAVAGHQPPTQMLVAGALAVTVGLTLAGATASSVVWVVTLTLIGLAPAPPKPGPPGCCWPRCPPPASSRPWWSGPS